MLSAAQQTRKSQTLWWARLSRQACDDRLVTAYLWSLVDIILFHFFLLPSAAAFVSFFIIRLNRPDHLIIQLCGSWEQYNIITHYYLCCCLLFYYQEYIDSELSAFTMYSYTVTACTNAGCTTSPPQSVQTLQSSPLSVTNPIIEAISSTGRLTSYKLIKSHLGMSNTL